MILLHSTPKPDTKAAHSYFLDFYIFLGWLSFFTMADM
jgi:hypothetical protein